MEEHRMGLLSFDLRIQAVYRALYSRSQRIKYLGTVKRHVGRTDRCEKPRVTYKHSGIRSMSSSHSSKSLRPRGGRCLRSKISSRGIRKCGVMPHVEEALG